MSDNYFALEFGERDEKCSGCRGDLVLVTAVWKTHPENEEDQDYVDPSGEVSGHYCPACKKLTAVFVISPK